MDSSISIPYGDDKTYKITITIPEVDGSGNPILDGSGNPIMIVADTTGWKVFFNVKRTVSDADSKSVIAKILDFTGARDDPIHGVVYLSLSAPDTRIKPDVYRYNMRAVDEFNIKQSSTVANFEITDVVNKDGSLTAS